MSHCIIYVGIGLMLTETEVATYTLRHVSYVELAMSHESDYVT